MLFILILIGMVLPIDSIYQSNIKFSSMGLQYQPINNIQLISTKSIQTKMLCSAACNQLPSCRIFDYDSVSKRCRLFEGDSTTGSTVSSSATSVVGTVVISSALYSPTYNQSCQSCQQNRYEVCSTSTNTCQCPSHTYWNGSVCVLQLFQNETCDLVNSCRSDLNLTCTTDCYGYSSKCLPSVFNNTTLSSIMPFGVTVSGACNGSGSNNQTILNNQAGIMLGYNNTLYVGDNGNRLLVFQLNNLIGRTLRNFSTWPAFMFLDNRTSNIYITVPLANLVYIWPTNQTIPPSGIAYGNCSMYWIQGPTGIVVDSTGNAYISSLYCNWIVKWAPNATSGTLFAGSPLASSGSNNVTLYAPHGMALDEPNSFLYVSDRYNYRIQRFVLGGSGIGVTVAGGYGQGSAATQLSRAAGLYISRLDGSLYIADNWNNRIQKWQNNATFGITVAGNSNGTVGNTPYLLNGPYALAFDSQENYMYVSDSLNNRVQRFSLH